MKAVVLIRNAAIVMGACVISSLIVGSVIRRYTVPGKAYSSVPLNVGYLVMHYWSVGWLGITGLISGLAIQTRRKVLASLVLLGLAVLVSGYAYLVHPRYRASVGIMIWPTVVALCGGFVGFHAGQLCRAS